MANIKPFSTQYLHMTPDEVHVIRLLVLAEAILVCYMMHLHG